VVAVVAYEPDADGVFGAPEGLPKV